MRRAGKIKLDKLTVGTEPLISIGLPVYNGERFIRRALDSLLAQSYKNFELIISDNASTDKTGEICREYGARDQRIRYTTNETNLGAAANFKRVLDLAGGSYFMWAAADDCWAPDFVKATVDELERCPESGVAMSAVDVVDEAGALINTIRFAGAGNPNGLNHRQMLLGLAVMGRRSRKYNFFIYGLFRADVLRQAMNYYVDTVAGDRLFMCLMALITRFRYVDEVLHTRMTHKTVYWQRYPDETASQIYYRPNWLYRILYYRMVFQLGRMLWRCDLIPTARKLYIPRAMWRMAKGIFLKNSLLYKWTAKFKRHMVTRFKLEESS